MNDNNEVVMLKQNHDYNFQIQTQLHITKITQCHFLYSLKIGFKIIKYNDNFCKKNIQPRLNMLIFHLLQ